MAKVRRYVATYKVHFSDDPTIYTQAEFEVPRGVRARGLAEGYASLLREDSVRKGKADRSLVVKVLDVRPVTKRPFNLPALYRKSFISVKRKVLGSVS